MLFPTLMVISLGVAKITADRSLSHLNWTKSIKNKYWEYYLSKHIFLCLVQKSMKISFLIPRLQGASFCSKYFKQRANKEVIVCQSYSLQGASGILTEPTLRVIFKSSLCTKTPSHLWWNLYLHPLLRLNLTIVSLRLREVFGNWEGNNVVVKSINTNEIFTFGGIQSNISLYLSDKDINFEANIKLPHNISFTIEILVIPTDIIRTKPTYHIQGNIEHLSHHRIPVKAVTVMIYKVQVQKFQTIQLRLTLADERVCVIHVFKGPGFFSKRFMFFDENKKLAVKTWQCIVQTAIDDPLLNWVTNKKISFSSKNLRRKVVHVSNDSLLEFVNFTSAPVLETEPWQSVLWFQSPPGTVVNITVTQFIFTGEPSNVCAFGGLAVFQFEGALAVEEFLFCNKYLTKNYVKWHAPRSMFSSTPSSLLVFYVHKEYATVQVKGVVTFSFCTIAKPLNMCEKLMEETGVFTIDRIAKFGTFYEHTTVPVDSQKCTILQVSTGMYKVFQGQGPVNIHSVSQNTNLFPRLCYFRLHLDQPSHNNLVGFHTVHVYGECCQPFAFSIKATETTSTNGKFTVQRFTQTQAGKPEENVYEFHMLSGYFARLWDVVKKDFLVDIEFIQVGPLRVHTQFSYWFGSWITYVIHMRSTTTDFKEREFVKNTISDTLDKRKVPVSFSLAKILWLEHVPQKPSESEAVFGLHGTQENPRGFHLKLRRWKSDTNKVTNHRKKFVLAVPGVFNQLEILLHKTSEDSGHTIIHTKWIQGTNITLNFSQIQLGPTGLFCFVQSQNYRFIANCLIDRLDFIVSWSWTKAAEQCNLHQMGHLPEFISRQQQDDFLNILKLSTELPWIHLLFIGLQNKEGKTDR